MNGFTKGPAKSPSMSSLDESQKKWMLLSAECNFAGLKELHEANNRIVNDKNFVTGYTALHWAAKSGHVELLNWLCRNGANINAISHGGYTPLHVAAMHRNAEVINILQTYGGSLDVRDNSGKKASWYMPEHSSWNSRGVFGGTNRNSSASSCGSYDSYAVISASQITDRPGNNDKVTKTHHGETGAVGLDRIENGFRKTMSSVAKSFRSKDRRRRNHPQPAKERRSAQSRSRALSEEASPMRGDERRSHVTTPKARHLSIEHPFFENEATDCSYVPDYKSHGLILENGEDDTEATHPAQREATTERDRGWRTIENDNAQEWSSSKHNNNNSNNNSYDRVTRQRNMDEGGDDRDVVNGRLDYFESQVELARPEPQRDWRSTTFV